MKGKTVFNGICFAALLCCSATQAQAPAQNDVVRKPLAISSGWEFGKIVQGTDEQNMSAEGYVINRLSVWLTQEAIVRQRLTLKMGIGGVFFYPFPDIGDKSLLVLKTGPGISQATGIYAIGGTPEAPLFDFQLGYFPFKYNPDAKNLGEYLLRSSCYPGIIRGPGWNMTGDALYRMQGFRLTSYLLEKSLTQHLMASMERDIYPNHDISMTYVGDYKPGSLLDFGAGFSLHRVLPLNGEKTTPEDFRNRYIGDKALNKDTGIVTDQVTGLQSDTLTGVKYYTFQGTKVMARVSVNPRSLISSDILGKDDLRLYGEISILGLKDYPFYFDDITKRMPVMFGFNVPTFRVLDVLSIELEWYGSQFAQSMQNTFNFKLPTWYIEDGSFNPASMDDSTNYAGPAGHKTYRDLYSNDNWKWSIFAKKRIYNTFSFHVQLANDHIRPKHFDLMDDMVEVTRGNKNWYDLFKNDWYFVFRLDYGI